MPVEVTCSVEVSEAAGLEAAADRLLVLLDVTDCELSVALIRDDEMRALNRHWRGIDRPTDVLSFAALDDGERETALRRACAGDAPVVLGDVVISLDSALRQARSAGWTLAEELNRLLLHGFLHLLGYDHESGAREAARMRAEERRLAAELVAAGFGCARQQRR